MKAKEGKPERREKRPQAPHRCSTPASMGAFSTVTVSLLLCLLSQLPGQAGANPLYGAVSSADLADFKVGPEEGCSLAPGGFLVPGRFLLILSKSVSPLLPSPCVFLL